MKESVKTSVRQILTSYLEKNNCRKTPERFAVLDSVYEFTSYFTMQELNDHLDQKNFHVSRTTLYNTLGLFQQLHLIVCHRLASKTIYEASYNTTNHCHQICTVCGKVSMVKSAIINKAIEQTHLKRFRREGFSLYLYGVCSTCQAKMTRQKKRNKNNNTLI